MTEGGKKLFKTAFIGMGAFFGILLIVRVFVFSSKKSSDAAETEREKSSFQLSEMEIDAVEDKKEEGAVRSANQRLADLLHSYAINYFQSKRLKNAIYLWEVAGFLEPANAVTRLRLEQAREALDFLVQENIALGMREFKYLRYAQAVEHWRRAANLVEGLDPKAHEKINRWIARAEGKLKQ